MSFWKLFPAIALGVFFGLMLTIATLSAIAYVVVDNAAVHILDNISQNIEDELYSSYDPYLY